VHWVSSVVTCYSGIHMSLSLRQSFELEMWLAFVLHVCDVESELVSATWLRQWCVSHVTTGRGRSAANSGLMFHVVWDAMSPLLQGLWMLHKYFIKARVRSLKWLCESCFKAKVGCITQRRGTILETCTPNWSTYVLQIRYWQHLKRLLAFMFIIFFQIQTC
jgi:hypothetical protein